MTESTSRPEGAVHQTVDLTEASFLAARGHSPRVIPLNQHQALFSFPLSPEVAASLAAYASGEQDVDVVMYSAMRSALRKKALIACAALRGGSV